MIRLFSNTTTALAAAALALAPLGAARAQNAADTVAPEAATGLAARDASQPVVAKRWRVSAANPLAAAAAADVLGKGGTAADAASTTQAVLGLVEPQSSGLGGGAFLLSADIAVRVFFPANDLKLGVVTALIGAPFFLWLLFTIRRRTTV